MPFLPNTKVQHKTKGAHKICQGVTHVHIPIKSFYRVWSLCKSFFIDNFLSWRLREKLTPDLSTIGWPCLRYQWHLNFMLLNSQRHIFCRTRDIAENVFVKFVILIKSPVTQQRFDAYGSYCACVLTRPWAIDALCTTFLNIASSKIIVSYLNRNKSCALKRWDLDFY